MVTTDRKKRNGAKNLPSTERRCTDRKKRNGANNLPSTEKMHRREFLLLLLSCYCYVGGHGVCRGRFHFRLVSRTASSYTIWSIKSSSR
jgi:hypothetical protein